MKEHMVDQRTEEWFRLRMGKLTSSRFPKLMKTPKQRTEWNETQLTILREIAAEKLTGEREETFTSKAMQWGNDHEDAARDALSAYLGMKIRESGFWEYSEYIGGSPDGIVGYNEAVAELKCPTSKQHILYYLDSDNLFKDYGWQLIGHMLCTGIETGYLASYDPRFPDDKCLVVVEHYMSLEEREQLISRLDEAVSKLKEWTA